MWVGETTPILMEVDMKATLMVQTTVILTQPMMTLRFNVMRLISLNQTTKTRMEPLLRWVLVCLILNPLPNTQ